MRDSRLITRKKDWAFIKDKVDNDGLLLDYEEGRDKVRVFIIKGNTKFFVNLFDTNHRFVVGQSSTNAADYIDFNDNYKSIVDEVPPSNPDPVTLSEIGLSESSGRKLAIHQSSRPQIIGKFFHTYWTGAGDDMATPEIGTGPMLEITNAVSTATQVVEAQYHKDYGDVYLHEGYVQWENAGVGDHIDVEIIATATPLQQATNLDYTIDASVKIRAASGGPGTGTDGLNGDPVWVPNAAGTGWWDTDGVTATFSATQTGAYDWYTIEIIANRFMNKIPVYGSSTSYIMLQSADTTLLPVGYLIRVTAHNVSDTIWRAWMFMTLYREQTV